MFWGIYFVSDFDCVAFGMSSGGSEKEYVGLSATLGSGQDVADKNMMK